MRGSQNSEFRSQNEFVLVLVRVLVIVLVSILVLVIFQKQSKDEKDLKDSFSFSDVKTLASPRLRVSPFPSPPTARLILRPRARYRDIICILRRLASP